LLTLKNRVFFLLLVSYFTSLVSYAQNSDGLWFGAGVEKTLIKKKLDLSLDGGIRYRTNYGGFNKFLLEPALTWRLSKKIDVFGSYRYTNAITSFENRFSIGSKWNNKIIKRTYLGIKVKYQTEKASNKETFENLTRIKLSLKHKIKKTKLYPYIYSQVFYALNPDLYGFDTARFGLGITIKSFKKQTIKLGYFRGTDFSSDNSKKRNIFNFSYNLKIK